jgi:capsid assembly protease
MKLLDVLTAPWAIEPAKLHEIQAIYATHLRGDKIDLAAVEARIGRPLANEPAPYSVTDGVAVLQVGGVMAKRMNLFSQISGGCSTQIAARDLQQAAADPAVHSIIQVYDTPGGTVDGTAAFANIIRQVGQQKTVVTLADGLMASAGVWAGTAARQIYIADSTTSVGSIGVVLQHVDLSGQDAQNGIKRTEVFAGKYKRIASDTGPLSKAGLQSLQDSVDYTYSLFVQAVATQRGVSVEQVLADMADGRMFIGEQAINAGLVDGVATLEELIVQLNQDRTRGTTSTARAGVAPPAVAIVSKPQGKSMSLTREQLALDHPELLQAVMAEGASAERTRIQAVEGQLIPGHEALINTLKFDGTSGPGEAAMAVNAAEKLSRSAQAAALASDAPAAVAVVAAATVTAPANSAPSRADLHALATAHQAAHPGTDYIAAYKAVGGQ